MESKWVMEKLSMSDTMKLKSNIRCSKCSFVSENDVSPGSSSSRGSRSSGYCCSRNNKSIKIISQQITVFILRSIRMPFTQRETQKCTCGCNSVYNTATLQQKAECNSSDFAQHRFFYLCVFLNCMKNYPYWHRSLTWLSNLTSSIARARYLWQNKTMETHRSWVICFSL